MKKKLNKNRVKKYFIIVLLITIGIIFLMHFGKAIKQKIKVGLIEQNSLALTSISPEDEELGRYAYVKNLEIIQRTTGTAPWDINNEPGNDNNADNNVVRSFDKVLWTVSCDLALDVAHQEESYSGGVLYVKAIIPQEISKYSEWDLDTMTWAENGEISNDKTTFTAYYSMSKEETTIPGNQELVFALKVLGAPNGLRLNPEFTVGLVGNEEKQEKTVSLDNNISEELVNSVVKVSAAPRLNIQIKKNGYLNYRSYFDFATGKETNTKTETSLYGRIQGYGITLQLYNPDFIDEKNESQKGQNKGLKGVAIPTGEITFDLEFNESLYKNSKEGADVTFEDGYTPTMWDYIENIEGQKNGKNNKNILWNNRAGTAYDNNSNTPFNKLGAKANSCYNGGNWRIIQDSNQKNLYHVSINDYIINSNYFPIRNAGSGATAIDYTENIGCFSSGYVQAIMQVPETVASTESIYMKAKVNNLSYKTTLVEYEGDNEYKNDVENNVEVYSKDNNVNGAITVYPPGSYSKYQTFHNENSTVFSLGSSGVLYRAGGGQACVALGNKFYLTSEIYSSASNDELENNINLLQKFDDRAYEPLEEPEIRLNGSRNIQDLTVLYAAKPDKKGWGWIGETQTNIEIQMENTREEELIFFDSYTSLKEAGYTCVGVLYEHRNLSTTDPGKIYLYSIKLKVKESATIGDTYQTVNDARIWTNDIDNFTWKNKAPQIINEETNEVEYEELNYPTNSKKLYNGTSSFYSYTKTEYDENMQKREGTHNDLKSGNTILVLGANLSVSKEINEKTESGLEKQNYNIGKNEFEVEYKIIPKLENPINDINITGVNLKILDTLPKGLTYISGSADCGEPEIIENEDNTQTLIWYRYNQSVNETILPITYKAKIYKESINGEEYTTTTVIEEILDEGETSKIGNTKKVDRTATKTISIVNLGNNGFYLEVEEPVIERNGEINYNLVLTKVTTSNLDKYQLVDILPYNNDTKGSNFSGGYTVSKIDIVQKENETENIISNDNLNLYVSNNESIIDEFSANKEITGIGTIWENVIPGDNINKELKGFVIKGNWVKDSRVEINVTLKTNGNTSNDIYYNAYSTSIVSDSADPNESNIVKTEVIKRELSGYVWLDKNANGIIDSEENYIKDVKVTLLNFDETPAKNVYGYDLPYTFTDNNGYYKFEDMKKGEYKVKFEYILNADKTEVTEKQVGVNKEINSKINEDGKTDVITELNNLNSPTIIEDFVNAGFVMQKRKLTVHYYFYDETKEGEEKKTENKVADDIINDVRIGDNYETNAIDADKLEEYYELVEIPSNSKGTMPENDLEVIYYYRYKSYPYTIKYVEKDNEENILKEENGTALYNSNVEVKDKSLEEPDIFRGYIYNSKNKDEIEIGTEGNTATVYYTRMNGLGYAIKYMDYDSREELKETKTQDGKTYGDKIKAEDERIDVELPDYYFVEASKEEIEISDNLSENVIELYYRKKGKVIVKYVDKNTEMELTNRVEITGEIGEEYELSAKEINEYTLVEKPRYEKDNFKVTPNPEEVVYYYKKHAKVIVKHIDRTDNTELKIEEKDGLVGDEYTAIPQNFEKYVLIERPEEETITMTSDIITLIYYYAKVSKGVLEKHINISTDEIIYNDVHIGNEGDAYNIESKVFDDYELVEERMPDNAKGEMKEDLIEVIYYYKHKTHITVMYLDTDGNEISEKYEINGYDGEEYETEPKEIEGYILVKEKLPANEKGKMTKEGVVVKYYYEKIKENEEPENKINEDVEKETEDSTLSDNGFPNAGRKKIIIAIFITLIGLMFALVNFIKYKDIK